MQRRQSLAWLGASLWAGGASVAHAYRPAPVQYRNALPAAQGQWLEVEVLGGQRRRQNLPIFQHRRRWYVGGEHGQPYQLLLRNTSNRRVLVVISVDGVNVLTGEPAAPEQTGYIINPQDTVQIEGWRKSLDTVAQFIFTTPDDSYAERTGQGGNTGVLGFAVFEEAAPPPRPPGYRRQEYESAKGAPRAPAPAGAAAESRSDMGTGHGQEMPSSVREVQFRRASPRPAETLQIHYASLAQLERQRIAQRGGWQQRPEQEPDPFPGERRFVPDPPPWR